MVFAEEASVWVSCAAAVIMAFAEEVSALGQEKVRKSVLQKCQEGVSSKSASQKCAVRVSDQSVKKACQVRASYKSVKSGCPTKGVK